MRTIIMIELEWLCSVWIDKDAASSGHALRAHNDITIYRRILNIEYREAISIWINFLDAALRIFEW